MHLKANKSTDKSILCEFEIELEIEIEMFLFKFELVRFLKIFL